MTEFLQFFQSADVTLSDGVTLARVNALLEAMRLEEAEKKKAKAS